MSSSWLSFYGLAMAGQSKKRHNLEVIAWRRLELVMVLSSYVSSSFLQLLGLARRTSTCLGKLVCGWSLCPETRLEPWLHITYVDFAANCSDYSSMKHTRTRTIKFRINAFYGAIPFRPLLIELCGRADVVRDIATWRNGLRVSGKCFRSTLHSANQRVC